VKTIILFTVVGFWAAIPNFSAIASDSFKIQVGYYSCSWKKFELMKAGAIMNNEVTAVHKFWSNVIILDTRQAFKAKIPQLEEQVFNQYSNVVDGKRKDLKCVLTHAEFNHKNYNEGKNKALELMRKTRDRGYTRDKSDAEINNKKHKKWGTVKRAFVHDFKIK